MTWIEADGVRFWIDDVEITRYLRTGRDPLTVRDGRVVFAETGQPWTQRTLTTRRYA